jgi:hypothetical protein
MDWPIILVVRYKFVLFSHLIFGKFSATLELEEVADRFYKLLDFLFALPSIA